MWYEINNIESIDSPALLVYPDRVEENIRRAIAIAGGVDTLRPHVKTNKMAEVCRMMMGQGIRKYKCATIAEAEMLGMVGAPDVLLAYQPVGPKIERLLKLVKAYPDTRFACLVDDEGIAETINGLCEAESVVLPVYIDINVGMNRTGIRPEEAPALIDKFLSLKHLRLAGLHAYDGQIHDTQPVCRQAAADVSFALADEVRCEVQPWFDYPLPIVMGGTPTFPMHLHRKHTECSPGTFVFWDWGYKQMLPDLPFEYAALVVSRVISIIDDRHICTDLGHKSVAAENPLPRVHFLNAPEAVPIGQSEEHLVLEVPDSSRYKPGDVLYGVPVHICPTVALYEKAVVIKNGEAVSSWSVIARNRYINF